MRIIFKLASVILVTSVLAACAQSGNFSTQTSALERPYQGGTARRERED